MRDTFVGCTWQKVETKTLSIWSYACGPEHGNTRLVPDDALPGFRLAGNSIAIRAFEKPATAPVESILDQVRSASPGPHSGACMLTPLPGDHGAHKLYACTPTGRAKTEWDAWEASPDHPTELDPPCGIMGPAADGDRYFEAMPDHPETVVFVDEGSEIQVFDVNTLARR